MHLTRHHGLGNDFLVALVDAVPEGAPELARRLCDRAAGIGADGLVFGTADGPGRHAFRLFNSDGSPAEVSGNGLACFGQAILRSTISAGPGAEIEVDTPAGQRRIRLEGRPGDAQLAVTVEMGTAAPGPDISDLVVEVGGPLVGRVASVDMGNPHLVVEVDDPYEVDLAEVGPALEAHFRPTGCNVHLVSVADRSTITMRPWERGAGLTRACGSGACAAAHSARAWGAVDDTVDVVMPGGRAAVTVGDPVLLALPAVFVDEHVVADG